MSYIFDSVPYFRALMRREYTRNLADGVGEFYPCIIHAVRVIRSNSLEFQCTFTDRYGGAGFLAPIEAFTTLPTPLERGEDGRPDMTYIQPYDCFSETFTVTEMRFHMGMSCLVLPGRIPARYRFTIDYCGSDLAEDNEQHKHHHVVVMENGQLAAVPNNRLIWVDHAYWEPTTERPDFAALGGEFYAE